MIAAELHENSKLYETLRYDTGYSLTIRLKPTIIGRPLAVARKGCTSKLDNYGADTIVKGWNDNDWDTPRIEEQYDPDRVRLVLKFVKQSPSSHQAVTKPAGVEPLKIGEIIGNIWKCRRRNR